MKSLSKHLKLEPKLFHSGSVILYFLHKNQLIKFKVKSNAFFVKKRKIRTMRANFYIVDFVVTLHAKYVVASKENLLLLQIQEFHLTSCKVCAAKFAIENFLRNLSKKELPDLLFNKSNNLSLIK